MVEERDVEPFPDKLRPSMACETARSVGPDKISVDPNFASVINVATDRLDASLGNDDTTLSRSWAVPIAAVSTPGPSGSLAGLLTLTVSFGSPIRSAALPANCIM